MGLARVPVHQDVLVDVVPVHVEWTVHIHVPVDVKELVLVVVWVLVWVLVLDQICINV